MNGMFAFAIWDKQKQELFLARDRIGIKLLYYAQSEDLILFASEAQSLLHSSVIDQLINTDELELETLASSLIKYNNEDTLIENAKSLLPGHYMKILANGKIHIFNYWDIPKVNDTSFYTDYTDLIKELNEILCSSVQYRLISDVPVSCFLSGGLDSSIIASIATNYLNDSCLTDITITYKECVKDRYTMKEDQYLHFSKLLSAHLGVKSDHRIIETGASEITIEQIDKIIDMAHLIDDSRLLSIYRNYELVKDLGFKVVLNGQGADELMGGYAGLPVFYNNLLNGENENLLAKNMLNLSSLSNPLIFNKNSEKKKAIKRRYYGLFSEHKCSKR
jgi:asparagine synthase (glutamine-hydrolysing)